MPICIPNALPARETLENENIFIMNRVRAEKQDIRPLRIAILNLMPTKIVTETQLLRLLSNTPLQIEITLLQMATHISKNTSADHLNAFYRDFDAVKNEKFDGLIVTGAPVENLPFEEVDYWDELCGVMDWARTNVHCTLYICWGAQAALYHKYGIPKYSLDKKMFGVFSHTVKNPAHPLVRGFNEVFAAPHSRHSEIRESDVAACEKLEILATSDEAGILLIGSKSHRSFFITGHIEYDYNTLALEYERDVKKNLPIEIPRHYYPDDDPNNRPINYWRGHAHLLFSNWLNYFVYQETPYDINDILPTE